MRILLLSPFPPSPNAGHGGGTYLAAVAAGLAELGPLRVLCPASLAEERAIHAGPPRPVHPCDRVVQPRSPELTGTSRWGRQLRTAWRWGIGGEPLLAAKTWSPGLGRVLRSTIERWRPDVVLVEMAPLAGALGYLAREVPQLPTVFTDHEAGEPAAEPLARVGGRALGLRRDRQLWRRFSDRQYPKAHLLQALNDADAATLSLRFQRPVAVRPAVVPLPGQPVDPGAAPPRTLFFGNHRHPPNADALQRLTDGLLQRLRREVPEASLLLGGGHRPERADDPPYVEDRGFVPDLGELLGAARCLWAPIHEGRGSRIKVLSALAHGLPVVTTPRGAEGIAAPKEALTVCGSDEEMVQAAAAFCRDPQRARDAGAAARAWAERSQDPVALARHQLELLAEAGIRR